MSAEQQKTMPPVSVAHAVRDANGKRAQTERTPSPIDARREFEALVAAFRRASMARYIDPKSDFGFKRLFGSEDNKEILKQFLYDVLALPHPIVDLNFLPTEQLPPTSDQRRGIYDVYCTDSQGQRFFVEMQKGHQIHVKERALFYSTFPITHQSARGEGWAFDLLPVYCLVILNFTLDEMDEETGPNHPEALRRVQLVETGRGQIFYDKLTYVWVEIPKFNKALTDDLTPAEQWLYFLKHLPALQEIPAELAREPFATAFAIAEESALSTEEYWQYEVSLKAARDLNAQLASARLRGMAEGREEGREKGREEERRAIARALLAQGVARRLIAQTTGLPEESLDEL
jgi:predicted transposase/invertase (TIGR01784 family)